MLARACFKSWNARLAWLYKQIREDLFFQNTQLEKEPVTLVASLKACIALRDLDTGRTLHTHATDTGHASNIYVANALVSMYGKCSALAEATNLFLSMPFHNVVTWTALITGYVENGDSHGALRCFERMKSSGCAPNSVTYVAAVMACANVAAQEEGEEVDGKVVKVKSLERGRRVHLEAWRSGCCFCNLLQNTLIRMYSKCGSMEEAKAVFISMPVLDFVSWNNLIMGYVDNQEPEVAMELFQEFQSLDIPRPSGRSYVAALMACTSLSRKEQGEEVDGQTVKLNSLETGMKLHSQAAEAGFLHDKFVSAALIDMYGRCGSLLDARAVFDRVPQDSLDVVLWTALILGCVESGSPELGLELFERMHVVGQGVRPNSRTYIAALMACTRMSALETGRKIHRELSEQEVEKDYYLSSCLVEFYGQCGDMSTARKVFESMSCRRRLAVWNSLMAGYSREGNGAEVLQVFRRLREEGLRADGISLLLVLTGCSHAGLMEEAKEVFEEMVERYGVEPEIEHYHCMVDLLGRANGLEEAVEFVKKMPLKATVVTWRTLLAACLKWKNTEVARIAYENLLRLDEKEAAAYVWMSQVI